MDAPDTPWYEALAERYTFERVLGRGGMATVWLVRDLRHSRVVALKVLHSELTNVLGPERFHREIRLAAGLQHPHILTVFDSGETAGHLWYTMPYVQGESLRERLRREQQMGIDDAVRLTCEVADALDYAHSQGVIHRDIKPENILLSRGHAVLADFGVALAAESVVSDRITQTGLIVGTVAYMSPEQGSGGEVDARTDCYSLGCVLYELLAGEPPYTGSSAQAIIAKRRFDPLPDIHRLRPNVPPRVTAALARALSSIPGDRFGTMGAFAQALAQDHFQDMDIPAAPETAGRRVPGARKMARYAMAGAAVVAAGSGIWWAGRHREPAVDGARRVAVLPFENRGRPQDDYFADGLSDEIRGKLTEVPGLEVIARGSSGQYRQSTKQPEQIARELGVRYLLTGTVRWEQRPGGGSRVRVSPELVEVGQRGPASARWQAPFEAPLTDIFQMQASIAANVAEALNVRLTPSTRETLGQRPTNNLAAYDEYLQALGDPGAADPISQGPGQMRETILHLERAVELDSTFALAWAQLARARTYFALGSLSDTLNARALAAAEKAVKLDPSLPAAHQAASLVYGDILQDSVRAVQEIEAGLAAAPNDAELLASLASWKTDPLHSDEAIGLLRRAQTLNPRSARVAMVLFNVLSSSFRFREAVPASDRAVLLSPRAPNALAARVFSRLAIGDSAGAVERARVPPPGADSTDLMMATLNELSWLRTAEQNRGVLSLPVTAFGGDRLSWAYSLTVAAWVMGDSLRFRAYADTLRQTLEEGLRADPRSIKHLVLLSQAHAFLGQLDEARRDIERIKTAAPPAFGLGFGVAYAFAGEVDSTGKYLGQAIDRHEIGYYAGVVRFAPPFASVRRSAGFRPYLDRLIAAGNAGR